MLPRENSWRSQRTKIYISWEVAPAATELGLRTSGIYDALVLWYNINSHFCPPWWLWIFLSCVSLGRYAMYLDIFPDGKRKLCHYGRFLGVETRFSSPLFSIRYEPNNSSCNWSIKTMTFRVIIFSLSKVLMEVVYKSQNRNAKIILGWEGLFHSQAINHDKACLSPAEAFLKLTCD